MANGQTVSNDVVVVAADADRLGQYQDALHKARVPPERPSTPTRRRRSSPA